MHSILFVCLGNICRSPTAEAVARQMARTRGLALQVDSAGTGDWHVGAAPYGPMQQAAARRGYPMADLRARQVTAADFARFDMILAMDGDNLRKLVALRPDAGPVPRLLTEFAPPPGADHVPDPYYTRDFDGTLRLIEACVSGLLDQSSSNIARAST